MKHYRNMPDAAFGSVLLLSGTVCALIMLATLVYQITCRMEYPDATQPRLWPAYLPYAAVIASIVFARRHLFGNGVRLWTYSVLAIATILALWFSFMWFRDPMHDIALFFGSHGRWGCSVINADGTHGRLIRDDTVPWMLFVPVLLTGVAHLIWTRTRKAQNNELNPTNEPAAGESI